EAAALHCLSVVKEHKLKPGDSFLVADCGGCTVDLTSRKLLPENKLSEITERIGDLCGSTFVDKEFLSWLGRKVGFKALESLKSNNYGQMQFLVQRFFCQRIKFKFNGELADFK
ncbi:3759_t:CDS:2, partial [Funneliformis mosseae]